MDSVTRREGIEIRIGGADLATKLDALGAAIAAVREAHKDTMLPECWAALNDAQENIAAAMIKSRRQRYDMRRLRD